MPAIVDSYKRYLYTTSSDGQVAMHAAAMAVLGCGMGACLLCGVKQHHKLDKYLIWGAVAILVHGVFTVVIAVHRERGEKKQGWKELHAAVKDVGDVLDNLGSAFQQMTNRILGGSGGPA